MTVAMQEKYPPKKKFFWMLFNLAAAALFAWVLLWRIPGFAGALRATKVIGFTVCFVVFFYLLVLTRKQWRDRFSRLLSRERPVERKRWWFFGLSAAMLMVLILLHSGYLNVRFPHQIQITNSGEGQLSVGKVCLLRDNTCTALDTPSLKSGIRVENDKAVLGPGESFAFEQNFYYPPFMSAAVSFGCSGSGMLVTLDGQESAWDCDREGNSLTLARQPIPRTWQLLFLVNLAALAVCCLLLALLLLPLELLDPQQVKSFSFHTFLLLLILGAFLIALAEDLTPPSPLPPLSGLNNLLHWNIPALSFNSYLTYLFAGAVLLAYFLIKPAARWLVLLIASYGVLFSFDPLFPLLLLAVTGISFVAGRTMAAAEAPAQKKTAFQWGALSILGLLLFFKYAPLLWGSLSFWAGADPIWRRILLPAGMSFYIFTAFSYLKDVQTGKTPAESHFGKFALYLAYFPKLLIGPIERPKAFFAQLEAAHPFDEQRFTLALSRIGLGLFKRLLVSNRLAVIADSAFADPSLFTSPELWIGLLAFTFQVYIDFSAYTDIAIGVSSLFGIQLSENFEQPYFATSIVDFWRRWHISFSTWLRDYVFLPLEFESRRLRTQSMQYLNILITFLISGMWHGATLNFLLWGGLHGVYQIGEDLAARMKPAQSAQTDENNVVSRFFRILFTFLLVMLAWVLFRAESFGAAQDYLAGLFNFNTIFQFNPIALGLDVKDFGLVLALVPVMLLLDLVQRKHALLAEIYAQPLVLRWGIYLAVIFAMLIFGYYGSYDIDFVYMQF